MSNFLLCVCILHTMLFFYCSAYLFLCSIDKSNTEMMLDSAVEVVETNPTDISTNDTADNRLDTSTSGESNSTSYIKSALLCSKH